MKKHAAHKHMKDAMESMKMAHKAMKDAGKDQEKSMAKKGDYKGNSAKRSNKAIESKK